MHYAEIPATWHRPATARSASQLHHPVRRNPEKGCGTNGITRHQREQPLPPPGIRWRLVDNSVYSPTKNVVFSMVKSKPRSTATGSLRNRNDPRGHVRTSHTHAVTSEIRTLPRTARNGTADGHRALPATSCHGSRRRGIAASWTGRRRARSDTGRPLAPPPRLSTHSGSTASRRHIPGMATSGTACFPYVLDYRPGGRSNGWKGKHVVVFTHASLPSAL